MAHIPPIRLQQRQEQEQEQGGLQQQLSRRQQRIAQLRVKRLSMSTIVDTSSSFSSFSSSLANPHRLSSSSTTPSSLPTSPISRHSITPTTVSSVGSIPFLESRQTSASDTNSNNNSSGGGHHRHSRRASSSMSSLSLSDWQLMSGLPVPGSPSAIVAPIHATPVPAQRHQQQQQWTTKQHLSQPSESDAPLQLPFPSRPNSFASSYQPVMLSRKNSQRSSNQQRQLDQQGTLSTSNTSHSNDNRYEKESNASFERICSLLTHLITDASTAVGASENGDSQGSASVPVMIPRYLPMDSSESENSDNDDHEQAQQQYQRETVGPEHEGRTNLMLDNARLDIDGGEDFIYDEAHGNIPESPREQIRRRIDDFRRKRLARTRSGSYIADPSKRTSLFLELQNLQAENLVGGQHPTIPALNQHHHLDSGFELEGKSRQDQDLEPMNDSVLSPVFDSFTAGYSLEPLSTTATTTTAVLSPTTPSRSLDFELFDSELGSPVTLTPRRRASFPPRRSDRIRIQHAEELQQVIQRVDAELDRTVETIDDLTRDLIAVAMHQNWMKAHLERTLGLQSPLSLTDFIQTDDSPFSMATAMVGESGVGTTSPKNPTIPRNRLEQIEDVIGATKALLSSKEFANYYQVLERVRIMEEDVYDDYEQDGGEAFEGSSSADTKQGHQQQQQRFSGSSFTLTNGSFRHSSSSTLSLETRFGSYADVKDGVPLTSSSNRPSIEWSDRIGAPYNNMSQDRIHPLAAPTSLEPLQQDPLSLAVSPSPIQRLELIGDQPSKQETTQQDQHPKTLSSLLFQITQEEGVVNDLSPDATLAIDKLILAVTHLVLLLFWTMALFLGVVITDGSILKNASRQLISSVEILQSHFTVPDSIHDDDDNLDRGLYSPATQDQGIKTTDKKQDEAQELDQTLLKTMLDSVPAPKPLRPYSSTSRRRRTRLSSQQRHHNHHILLRRRQSSLLPQINAPEQGGEGVFGGSLFTSILGVGRFYNSPFLASSRYQVDISSKEPKAIQLGTGHGPLSVPSTSASTSSPTTTSTVLPESFPSSCSSTNYLQDQDFLSSSISTVSSSATLLDWLDSATFSATNLTHTQGSRQKKDAQISTTSSTDNSNSNENISKGPSYESAAAPLGIN